MRVAVPREIDADEPRVAATPETVKKLKSFGADVAVARGAGIASGIPDSEFEAAGAQIADVVTKDADIVLKVRRPAPAEDRKSTRLNSSHLGISYAVFCLKK